MALMAASMNDWLKAGLFAATVAAGWAYNRWNTEVIERVSFGRSVEKAVRVAVRRLQRDVLHVAPLTSGRYAGHYAIIDLMDDAWEVTVTKASFLPRRPDAGLYGLSDSELEEFLSASGGRVIPPGTYARSVLSSLGYAG
ncbi:hypothetical protein [Planctomonas deserti]|uniref:hypothetical protein n=1 Tax=Planctomonas deserti TaxID=2144185 RepID=UPI00131EE49D|nr:hypothetical protein [Planctomonas deserti]